jgi:hypothetical protein
MVSGSSGRPSAKYGVWTSRHHTVTGIPRSGGSPFGLGGPGSVPVDGRDTGKPPAGGFDESVEPNEVQSEKTLERIDHHRRPIHQLDNSPTMTSPSRTTTPPSQHESGAHTLEGFPTGNLPGLVPVHSA